MTIVERDILPGRPATRRAVPQAGLPHIPAARGVQIMTELIPGFLDELVAGGARFWNEGELSRLCVSFNGHRFVRSGKIPDPTSVVMYFVHRPFLEWSLRRVTGVVLAQCDSGAETSLTADLVVDATGRGSRAPLFLDELGYRRPREDTLTVHVTYAGLPVHLPRETLRKCLPFAAPEPSRPRGYAMFAGQQDTYMLAVQTVTSHKAPGSHVAAGLADRDGAPARAGCRTPC